MWNTNLLSNIHSLKLHKSLIKNRNLENLFELQFCFLVTSYGSRFNGAGKFILSLSKGSVQHKIYGHLLLMFYSEKHNCTKLFEELKILGIKKVMIKNHNFL
jgi:hypothetical protein